ncbi:MAG TPA: hypothetical protein VGS06_25335 [Streptosporangiaceae bacterium]|nr:hypothetical protein [Streptosporangiaceae bacterium]
MAADVSRRAGAGVSGPDGSAPARKGWTTGRLGSLVAGSILVLLSAVLLAGAGVLTWADQEQRGGYLTTGTATYSTGGYALASDPVNLHGRWGWLGSFAGEVKIRVTATRPGTPVFVAIGPADAVSRYLSGVSYTSVTALGDHGVTQHPGSLVPASPSAALDWAAQVHGAGPQTLRWAAHSGDWMVVVMNADGSPGVTIRTDMGVTSPVLPSLAAELLAAGLLALLAGAVLVGVPVRLAAGSARQLPA